VDIGPPGPCPLPGPESRPPRSRRQSSAAATSRLPQAAPTTRPARCPARASSVSPLSPGRSTSSSR